MFVLLFCTNFVLTYVRNSKDHKYSTTIMRSIHTELFQVGEKWQVIKENNAHDY